MSQKSLNEEERGGNCLLVPERSYGPVQVPPPLPLPLPSPPLPLEVGPGAAKPEPAGHDVLQKFMVSCVKGRTQV